MDDVRMANALATPPLTSLLDLREDVQSVTKRLDASLAANQ